MSHLEIGVVSGFLNIYPRGASRHADDDFADLLVRLHVAMRFHDLSEREHAIDLRFKIALLHVVEHVFLRLGCQFRVGENLAQRIPAYRQPFVQSGKQGKWRRFGSQRSVLEYRSVIGSCMRELFNSLPANRIENYARPFASGNLFHARQEVFLFGHNHVLRSGVH